MLLVGFFIRIHHDAGHLNVKYAFLKVKPIARVVVFVPRSGPVSHVPLLQTASAFGTFISAFIFLLPSTDLVHTYWGSVHVFGIFCPYLWTYIPVFTNTRACSQATGCGMRVGKFGTGKCLSLRACLSLLSITIPPALIFHQRCNIWAPKNAVK